MSRTLRCLRLQTISIAGSCRTTSRAKSWNPGRVRALYRRYSDKPGDRSRAPRVDPEQAVPLTGYYAELLAYSSQDPRGERVTSRTSTTVPVTQNVPVPSSGVVITSQQASSAPDKRAPQNDIAPKVIAGITVPPKPIEPDNCCMSGCVNCVWDMYREELEEWAAKSAEANVRLAAAGEGTGTGTSPVSKTQAVESGHIKTGEIANDKVDDALDNVPVGMREFVKMEKMLKERRQQKT